MAGIGCAYALALQILFAGVLATQMAVAGPVDAAICIAGSLNLPIAGLWRVRVEILVDDFIRISIDEEVQFVR
ncbi:MAG: hypothetical protein K2Z80_01885 [Xanthobacteraceae bacterium]|nr:hypothetical protein [Xanthobacteraceae bacterium]